MNTIKICDLGKMSEYKDKFIETIKELDNSIEIEVNCLKMCGICNTKYFAIIDGIPLMKDSYEELINSIKEKI